MKSLTKENFWNELTEDHPSAMDAFCKWIDEYKKRINWSPAFLHPTQCAESGYKIS